MDGPGVCLGGLKIASLRSVILIKALRNTKKNSCPPDRDVGLHGSSKLQIYSAL